MYIMSKKHGFKNIQDPENVLFLLWIKRAIFLARMKERRITDIWSKGKAISYKKAMTVFYKILNLLNCARNLDYNADCFYIVFGRKLVSTSSKRPLTSSKYENLNNIRILWIFYRILRSPEPHFE